MKVLLAEDDFFFQKFYSTELTEKGYTVELATNGEEAIQKAKEMKPDIMLLDLIMPKKDGFEVLTALTADSSLKKIPVIIFSTLGQESDIEKAKQLGAKDYINKNLADIGTLVTKLNSLGK